MEDEFFSRGKRRKTPKYKQRYQESELEKKMKGNLDIERVRERGRSRQRVRSDFFRDREYEFRAGRIEQPERIMDLRTGSQNVEVQTSGNQEVIVNFEKGLPSPTAEALNRFRALSQLHIKRLKREGFDASQSISQILEHIRGTSSSSITPSDLSKVMQITGISEKEATSALVLKEEVQKMRSQGKSMTQIVEELVDRIAKMAHTDDDLMNPVSKTPQLNRKRDLSQEENLDSNDTKKIKLSSSWNSFDSVSGEKKTTLENENRKELVQISDENMDTSTSHSAPLSLPPLYPHSRKSIPKGGSTPPSFFSARPSNSLSFLTNTQHSSDSEDSETSGRERLKRVLESPQNSSSLDVSKRLKTSESVSSLSPHSVPTHSQTTTTTTTTTTSSSTLSPSSTTTFNLFQ